ncbi:hypothetical protein C8R48DRAFT_777403 [Suillus tomentosus]|nr:hypothetical protein C8R48DRAFT_777403 [Suillus tomentosus]
MPWMMRMRDGYDDEDLTNGDKDQTDIRLSDNDSHKRSCASSEDSDSMRYHKRTCQEHQEDQSSLQQTHQRLPRKVRDSKGRVAAHDYEDAVQQLIKYVIGDFRSRLASDYAYPDRVTQVSWAKEAWKEACKYHETDMAFNNDIIQMITRCTSHLTSEIKAKVRPLVESIYGFESSTKESIKSRNHRLAQQLKQKFGLCYHNLGDVKKKVPRSGLFRTKLTQKAANLIWYRNKKDEGIVFAKYFTLFAIPAMALCYTAAECCIDEWVDGDRVDISFSGDEYQAVYDKHLANLNRFHLHTKDLGILDAICKEINVTG